MVQKNFICAATKKPWAMATMVYMQVSMMMVLSDSWVERLDEGRGLECLTAEDLGCTVA